MNIDAKIKTIKAKIVALAKAQSRLILELEQLENKQAEPAPAGRKNLKRIRIQEVENFYTKRITGQTTSKRKSG